VKICIAIDIKLIVSKLIEARKIAISKVDHSISNKLRPGIANFK